MTTDAMHDRIGEPIKDRSTWIRGAFMLLFAAIFGIVQFLLGSVAILQFLFLLFTGRRNDELAAFGGSLGHYASQVVRFTSCASDDRPFPFAPWPPANLD